ncbi:hypothetical protein ACFX15_006968 [Malus domestica]
MFSKLNPLLPLKNYRHNGGVLVVSVKRCRTQTCNKKLLVSVFANDLDATVVYAGPFVGISDGKVECKVVVENVVSAGSEIKLGVEGKGYYPEEGEDGEDGEDVEDDNKAAAVVTP